MNGHRCAHCGEDVTVHERDFDSFTQTAGPRLWLHFGCEDAYYHDLNVNMDAYASAAGVRGAQ
jgi:hypothetical protein